MEDIAKFIKDQLSVWPLAASNFRSLKSMKTREVQLGGLNARVQFNPCRIVSSTAEVDPQTIASRKCFLCAENRPPEQFHVKFEGRKGRRYNIQVNPFPIFPDHLVIAREEHLPQTIWHHLPDMFDFASRYRDYTVYYNGPMSGASAPDHLHFQACHRGMLPLETAVDAFLSNAGESIASVQDAGLYRYRGFTRGVYCMKADTTKSLAKLFYQFLDCFPMREGDTEPRLNLYTWYHPSGSRKGGEYRMMVVLRTEIRSHHYSASGEDHLTISPGAAEMAGVFVAPVQEDFDKVTAAQLEQMLAEVSISAEEESMIEWRLSRTQPKIDVGIMSAPEITFEIISDGAGPQKVSFDGGRINYNGTLYDELVFDSCTRSTLFAEPSFVLYGVTIGIDFHWQRKQNQKFAGSLRFIVEGDKLVAVNRVGVEDYLLSVISSEMKASATLEFLKAHAVISRSWVMSQIGRRRPDGNGSMAPREPDAASGEFIKWFDHDDHVNFDVCADDHCQRYQGLSKAVGATVREAIDQTWGQVLMSDGEICDARFSKSCGGMMEEFSACWEDRDYSYLQGISDTAEESRLPDLTDESEAEKWILDSPEAFCNTSDMEILGQVLNDFDLETMDFYRWRVSYGRDEISELFARRSGMALGRISSLEPVERGVSGRLKKLRVTADKGSIVIGKELIIRKFLSTSHLKSSAFIVRYHNAAGAEVPASEDWSTLELVGAGWGHGVGLCQIGAAVMSFRGYTYDRILAHYYPGSVLERK